MHKLITTNKIEMNIAHGGTGLNNPCMVGFGRVMRERARELGLPDAEIARRLGISARRYSFYVNEERQPDYALLLRICDVLGISPNHLLGYQSNGVENIIPTSADAAAIVSGIRDLSETKLRALRGIVEALLEPPDQAAPRVDRRRRG